MEAFVADSLDLMEVRINPVLAGSAGVVAAPDSGKDACGCAHSGLVNGHWDRSQSEILTKISIPDAMCR